MDDSQNNAISCKVVFLGETGVGKTSIIQRYIHNSFLSNSMATTGASFGAKPMYLEEYDKHLKFEIWDTAGQEKYKSLAKIFYKDAAVAILVYDITRKQSFDEIKNYWIGQLRENASKNLIIALAANKSDMYENEEVEEKIGRLYSKEINAIFKYTSAKNASGIDELFKAVGKKYIDPMYDDLPLNERLSNLDRRQSVKLTDKNTDKGKKKKCC